MQDTRLSEESGQKGTNDMNPEREQKPESTSRMGRRSFMKNLAIGGAALLPMSAMLTESKAARASSGSGITPGDAAILQFLAAAEIIESDIWQQYNELGGIQDSEVPGGSGNVPYTHALKKLDGDMPQYIHDNTEDEFSHWFFINGYLKSKGIEPVDLDSFRTLSSSTAPGAQSIGRLTNLMQLTVDTSWWTRYRSRAQNPDLDPNFVFPQAVPGLSMGQWPAIPRSKADLGPHDHIQAIANTAGFHFAWIEQGGSSLYHTMAQKVTSAEVLEIVLGIGPVETSHFQTWHDKAGNAPPLTDPTNGLVFPDLNAPPFGGEDFQTNLIMPEPCPFISRNLPVCSVIRPISTKRVTAMGVVKAFTADGLFIGQSSDFFTLMMDLARQADAAVRGF